MARNLNTVIQLNISSVRSHIKNLKVLIGDICLKETHLHQSYSFEGIFNFTNGLCHCRQSSGWSGITRHNSIGSTTVNLRTSLQAVAIRVTTHTKLHLPAT